MSKFNSLFNKVAVYEKLSVYGDRSEFLQSLSQDYTAVSDADLASVVNAVKSAVYNFINTDADVQPNLPGGRMKGLPPGLINPFQTVRGTNKFDVQTLPALYQALRQLSNVNNLGNASNDAKSAWLKSVFPLLGTAEQAVKKQMDYLNAFIPKSQAIFDTVSKPAETEVAGYKSEKAPSPAQAPAQQKSLSEAAKSLARIMTNKVSKLQNSFNRDADLKNINENVKSLQRYFKALQNKSDMPSYFARMEIVKALQNLFNELGELDLNVVSALNNGQGIPETPDSKI